MIEAEYLAELKRRRAITQSFTWKIALPFWKLERCIKEQLAAADGRPATQPGPSGRLARLCCQPLILLIRLWNFIIRRSVRYSLEDLPPRTAEVLEDLQRERARRQNRAASAAHATR